MRVCEIRERRKLITLEPFLSRELILLARSAPGASTVRPNCTLQPVVRLNLLAVRDNHFLPVLFETLLNQPLSKRKEKTEQRSLLIGTFERKYKKIRNSGLFGRIPESCISVFEISFCGRLFISFIGFSHLVKTDFLFIEFLKPACQNLRSVNGN